MVGSFVDGHVNSDHLGTSMPMGGAVHSINFDRHRSISTGHSVRQRYPNS